MSFVNTYNLVVLMANVGGWVDGKFLYHQVGRSSQERLLSVCAYASWKSLLSSLNIIVCRASDILEKRA